MTLYGCELGSARKKEVFIAADYHFDSIYASTVYFYCKGSFSSRVYIFSLVAGAFVSIISSPLYLELVQCNE